MPGRLRIGGPRTRAVLAMLACEPGRAVPVRALVDGVYGAAAPADAVNALQSQVGPGGSGKTRLALEVARGLDGEVGLEVGLVELAALPPAEGAEGTAVPAAVLDALGLREAGLRLGATASSAVERLVAALAGRAVLLVLDNCEHVLDAVAQLTDRLLGSCPGLRVVATSREPIGITAEQRFPVPPLSVSPLPTSPPGGDPRASPAATLFAQRAAAVSPGFRLAADLDSVIAICTALDGLPLAIELAAARAGAMPVREIAARLDDRFRLLSRGDRAAPSRHRTLRNVVAWSWDLLDGDERRVARRFSVLVGGATVPVVEQVCGADGSDTAGVLARLVEKSVVELTEVGRYRMLETIRVFCAEQLAASRESERVRARHVAYHHDPAVEAEPHLRRGEQLDWLRLLDVEHGNVVAALRRAIATAPPTALRMITAMTTYWWMRGRRAEGGELAAELLARIGPMPPPGLDEEFVACVASAVAAAPDPAGYAVELEACRAVVESWTRPPRPMVMMAWAAVTGPPSDRAPLIAMRREQAPDDEPWGAALRQLGWALGDVHAGAVEAVPHALEGALATFRRLGDRWGQALVLSELAMLADWRGAGPAALALVDEAIELCEQIGAAEDVAEMLVRRAGIRRRAGGAASGGPASGDAGPGGAGSGGAGSDGCVSGGADSGSAGSEGAWPGAAGVERAGAGGAVAAAQADLVRAIEIARPSGSREVLAGALAAFAEAARLDGQHDSTVRRLCADALEACPAGGFGPDGTRARVLVTLGRVAEGVDDGSEAEALHRRALTVAVAGGHRAAVGSLAVEGLAGVALRSGDARRAATLLGVGLALRGTAVVGDPDVARVATGARDALGPAGFEEAYGTGARADSATALAMAESAG